MKKIKKSWITCTLVFLVCFIADPSSKAALIGFAISGIVMLTDTKK